MSGFNFTFPYMVGDYCVTDFEGRCDVIPGWREGERTDLSVMLFGEDEYGGVALVDPPLELASKIESWLWQEHRDQIEEIEAMAWRVKRRMGAL